MSQTSYDVEGMIGKEQVRDVSLKKMSRKMWSNQRRKHMPSLSLFVLSVFVLVIWRQHTYLAVLDYFPSRHDGSGGWSKAPSAVVKRDYSTWRSIAVNLAKLPADRVLLELQLRDPFGTRRVAQKIQEAGGVTNVSLHHLQELFPCPKDNLLSAPDQRNHSRTQMFRNNETGSFLFFQHLRKAGGTNFCELANANLPSQVVPSFFCMPDFNWKGATSRKKYRAGHLHHYTNEQIIDKMGSDRIAGNEWDSFDPTRHFKLPGAVFVTSFRNPVHRAVSQYRFEECSKCTDDDLRDTIGEWWQKRRDLHNVYTWTFSDSEDGMANLIDHSKNTSNQRALALGKALDTVAKFHLVMSMELLPYAAGSVQDLLGFHDTSALTRPTRPHNRHKQIETSLIPEQVLTAEQYKKIWQSLALDEILTDAAQRLFLERLVCGNS